MLEVRGLEAGYGAATILQGISLQVGRGEVVALLGRNGAGKSTLMKSLMGLLPPRRGSIRFDGQEIAGQETHRIARAGIGYVPEDRRIFTDLTVAENLEAGRRPPRAGAPVWDAAALIRLFPNLAGLMQRPGGRISGGEQQMLTLARTLMGNPALLLLDEPSEGISPLLVAQLAEALTRLKADGLTILLSEQNLKFCAALADRAYILETGCIRADLPMAAVMQDAALRQRWLSV